MRTSTPRAPRAISTIAPRGVPSGATAMAPTWARTITTSAPRARSARASAFIAGTGGKNWNSPARPTATTAGVYGLPMTTTPTLITLSVVRHVGVTSRVTTDATHLDSHVDERHGATTDRRRPTHQQQ